MFPNVWWDLCLTSRDVSICKSDGARGDLGVGGVTPLRVTDRCCYLWLSCLSLSFSIPPTFPTSGSGQSQLNWKFPFSWWIDLHWPWTMKNPKRSLPRRWSGSDLITRAGVLSERTEQNVWQVIFFLMNNHSSSLTFLSRECEHKMKGLSAPQEYWT